MATTIITKNNSIPGVAPSAGQLVQGELAVNVSDRKIYTLDASNQVVLVSSGSDYDVPVTVDVNSASTAVTIDQAGAGGGLRITNTGSGNSLLVEDSANPDSSPFVIDNGGFIITGATTNQAANLATGNARLQILGGTAPLAFYRDADSSTAINLEFAKRRATGGVLQSGDTIGRLYFSGNDGTAAIPAAFIDAAVDGTPGTNDMPGRLVFSTTADGAATPTERLRITSTGALAVAGASNYGTQGQSLISSGNAAPAWVDQTVSISFTMSGSGATIPAGIQGDLVIPFACVIEQWTLLSNISGSIVVDIWKDTYVNAPPTAADSITGTAKPTISVSTKGQSSTLTGWTTAINANDILRFNVDSSSTLTIATLSLKVRKT